MPAVAKTDRETILRAALRRVRREGVAALSLRSLAGDVGITTNALYHYFPDRARLEEALSDAAAALVHEALTAAPRKREPAKRLLQISQRYLQFARANPHLYDLLFAGSAERCEESTSHMLLWDSVVDEVRLLHLGKDAEDAAVSLWALLHGAVSLERAGVLEGGKPRNSVAFGLRAWLAAAKR